MDIFLDMTGTITSMESEDYAFLKMCEAIKKRFNIDMGARELMEHILEFRRPYMENRHVEYYPIRNLIVKAVEKIVPKRLCSSDAFWIMDAYSEFHARYVKLAPRAKEGLDILREISKHLGLITDADTPYTQKVLKGLGIEHYFDSVTTAEDAGVGKPNPKIFEMALKNSRENLKIYIGDSEKRDIVGAKNVGIVAIKIGGESRIADYTATNLFDAAKIIKDIIL